MAAVPESGFLLVADLTGYTAYLASGEIEHAPTIAGDLLETIVGRLEPPYRLAKLEGDAAFLFVEDGRADGSLLLDSIEASYLAFRRRLRSIEAATTCDCNACRQAPRLDLKYFVHHGQFVRSRIAGRDEIAGSSVIVVHRLLKGATAAAAHNDDGRANGFAVITGEAVEALGIGSVAVGLTAGQETIEHIGSVATFTMDLEARWQAESVERRLGMDGALLLDIELTLPARPAVVWAYLTSPKLRPTWEGPIRIDEQGGDGRRGVGTTSACVTSVLSTLEQIVDWQPFEHAGYRLTAPGIGDVAATWDLVAEGESTRVRLRWTAASELLAGTSAVAARAADKRRALGRLREALSAGTALQPPVPRSREARPPASEEVLA